MASKTIDRIFENSSTSEPLYVPKTPVASSGRPGMKQPSIAALNRAINAG